MLHERFLDRNDKSEIIKRCPDFVFRDHGVTLVRVAYLFVIALTIILISTTQISIRLILLPQSENVPLRDILLVFILICLCVFAATIFACMLIVKTKKFLRDAEFQNMLFAAAASVHTDFTLIVTSDKDIIYYDGNFNKMFSPDKIGGGVFNSFISNDGLKKSDSDYLLSAIIDQKCVKVPFTIKENGKEVRNITIAVDQLSRPSGFSIIRGRSAR